MIAVSLHPASHGLVALTDDADADLALPFKWAVIKSAHGGAYAHRSIYSRGKATSCLLHRVIAGAAHGDVVDHVNGDGLDNRRANLRVCTRQENARNRPRPGRNNTSGVTGVSRGRSLSSPWEASIKVDGRRIYLGSFAAFADAVAARRHAEASLFGTFAPRRTAGAA